MTNIFKTAMSIFLLAMALVLIHGCKNHSTTITSSGKNVTLVSEIILPIGEPSGITYSPAMNKLWVVAGGDQHVYRLDTSGSIEQQLPFTGTDLEGITFDERDSTLWVVDEEVKEIVHLNLLGEVLFRKNLLYSTGIKNKGPEGITLGPDHLLYIINERDPSIILHLDSTFEIASMDTIAFASDYSDISYSGQSDSFFIISDESRGLFVWSASKGISEQFALPDAHNEGVAFDPNQNILFIVNDATAKFYRYALK
jgi:uncharacterized protein YjiK